MCTRAQKAKLPRAMNMFNGILGRMSILELGAKVVQIGLGREMVSWEHSLTRNATTIVDVDERGLKYGLSGQILMSGRVFL